jgi:hypothetical protein
MTLPQYPQTLYKILEKHGGRIRDLDVVLDDIHSFAELLRHCPSMERLSLHTYYLRLLRLTAVTARVAVSKHQTLAQIRVVSLREGCREEPRVGKRIPSPFSLAT